MFCTGTWTKKIRSCGAADTAAPSLCPLLAHDILWNRSRSISSRLLQELGTWTRLIASSCIFGLCLAQFCLLLEDAARGVCITAMRYLASIRCKCLICVGMVTVDYRYRRRCRLHG
jgi:hypothetical protein